MAENKTQETEASVQAFIDAIDKPQKREDAQAILEMMAEVSGEEPKLWGGSLIGFGRYHYVYDSGREGDFFRVGFSPRKSNISLYIMSGFGAYEDLMGRLGKHKSGKSCLYINKLADVDQGVLRELVEKSLAWMAEKYPE